MICTYKWRYVYASVAGTSHERTQIACQDYSKCALISDKSNNEIIAAAVSDGAGSAFRSAEGAKLACESLVEHLRDRLREMDPVTLLTREFITEWIIDFQEKIKSLAEAEDLIPRDFACTLVAAVLGNGFAAFMQVGDGGIVFRQQNGVTNTDYIVKFWPDQGEYANQTTFLTDARATENLQFEVTPVFVDECALFSDGLQRLVLHFQDKEAHRPFFQSIFSPIYTATGDGELENLREPLTRFLNSPMVNQRTDDDKTLILVTRRDLIECSKTIDEPADYDHE